MSCSDRCDASRSHRRLWTERTSASAAVGIDRSLDAASGSWLVIPLDGRVLGIAMSLLLLLLASGCFASRISLVANGALFPPPPP